MRFPYSSRVVINEDEFLRLIDQMRISVPQEIKNARQIEMEREARLAAAQDQAEAMIVAAREKAVTLTSEQSVLEQARERADELLARAYEEGNAVRGDADAYALEVLERIGAQLDSFGHTVRNGMRLLHAGERVEAPARDPARVEDEDRTEEDVAAATHVDESASERTPRN